MNPPSDFQNPHSESSSRAAAGNPKSYVLNPEPRAPARPAYGPRRQSANPFGGPGRPRKLDEVALREICALVTAGCGIEGAARYVGCAASTIRREALRNDAFGHDLRRAHLTAELGPLNAVRQAATRYWRAGAWFLERTNPQRFSKQPLAFLKPEQLKEYNEILMDIIREETANQEVHSRIARRLDLLHQQAVREVWATRHDSCPRPRRRWKSAMRAAAMLPPHNTQPGSSDARSQK